MYWLVSHCFILFGSRSASTPSPKIFAETKKTSAPTPASLPKPPSAWFNAAAASKTTLAPFSAQVVTALPSPVVMDSPKMRHPSDESMTSVLSDESSKSDTSTCFAEFAKLCLQGQQGGDMFASQHLKGLLKVH